MKIVNVMPLVRGITKETLAYFTSKEVEIGSFVRVSLRNKEVPAIVISFQDALDSKSAIKGAPYGMKKIIDVYNTTFFSPAFIKAAGHTAHYFATTTGSVIESLTPQPILRTYLSLKNSPDNIKKDTESKIYTVEKPTHEKFLFQANEEDRIASYKSLIREYFAQRKSIFLCLPTLQDIEHLTESLGRGIEEYTYVLHGGLNKKIMKETWKNTLSQKHPVLIIGTGKFLCIPRKDIGAIIVEKENSNGYKMLARPYLDIRTFAEFFAKEIGAKLIYGDIFLRVETIYRKDRDDFLEFAPLKFRSLTSAEQKMIDMKKYKNLIGDKKFVLLSDEVVQSIKDAHTNNESFFLLTSRRGLYPITVCSDCGDIVRCEECSVPLVLHGKKGGNLEEKDTPLKRGEKNIFICHTCGDQSRSYDLCRGCSGWRLTTLGIGSERVAEEVKTLFPHATVLRLDKDTAARKHEAKTIMKRFYASPNSILVGTEMAIPYIHKEIPNTAIISIDSLFTIPDFRIYERVFAQLLRLRAKTTKKFFIQTRLTDTTLFQNVLQGNLLNFYREEINGRERFNYPPFSLLIKITRTGKKYLVERDMKKLEEFLKNYDPLVFPAFAASGPDKYIGNALIRIDRKKWPDNTIRALLAKLPLSFSIKVDPEDIL